MARSLVEGNELVKALPGRMIAAWAYEIQRNNATISNPPVGLLTPQSTPASSDYMPRTRRSESSTFLTILVRPEFYSRVVSFLASLEETQTVQQPVPETPQVSESQ
ncbi:hypothetical protein J8273_6943 [Carpediemonas membranifera]|uniref:Uncharacterized protein n=1 Tax=Carpediemonas membranifera TaxID=201153 RepID=A0A8J6B144_9EUKA|nr:hypothetical protein J8273_6943 [Carpediemonas membranifera]|eukprot:KAG9390704.1 hypothetical protein J8273_6943 [Carpediemonas membranifera]